MKAKNTFLICARDFDKKDRLIAEPGNTTFLAVPISKRDYGRADVISKERWTKLVIAEATHDEDAVTESTGDILFFCSRI